MLFENFSRLFYNRIGYLTFKLGKMSLRVYMSYFMYFYFMYVYIHIYIYTYGGMCNKLMHF